MEVDSVQNMSFHDVEHKFEKKYWGDCTNTFLEEQKHFVQARLMGIKVEGYSFDATGMRILDIGGGPVSMLLKAKNLAFGMVCDPITYPAWVYERYRAKGIIYLVLSGEHVISFGWDEVWIYNCLQHTTDPKKIIDNAKKAAPLIRIFEWIDFPPHPGQAFTPQPLARRRHLIGIVPDGADIETSVPFAQRLLDVDSEIDRPVRARRVDTMIHQPNVLVLLGPGDGGESGGVMFGRGVHGGPDW